MTLHDVVYLLLGLLLAVSLGAGVRLALAPRGRRRAAASRMGHAALTVARVCGRWALHVLLTLWVLASWRRVTRNLGLAYADKHAIKRVRTTDRRGVTTETQRPRVAYPYLFARPDAYGVVLTVWTRVGVGRADFDKAAEHLANTWRCRRVQVEQRKPGRITIRGLRRDPLAAQLSLTVPDISPDTRTADTTTSTREGSRNVSASAPLG